MELKVFVCSTSNDLRAERDAALDAIRRCRLRSHAMEAFGARTDQPIEACLEEVQRSDVLVVIVGHKYGSIVPALGISFSEAEYRKAWELKKPCFVYVRPDSVRILPEQMEVDPDKRRLLGSWKATLQERHTVCHFEKSEDLAVQVAADLSRVLISGGGRFFLESGIAYSNLHELQRILERLERISAHSHSNLHESRKSVRKVLVEILSLSLETETYLVTSIADASTQDIWVERELLQKWHILGGEIYMLGVEHEALNYLAEEMTLWASSWVSHAIWSAGQNEKSLETARRLSQKARELLGEI